MAHGGSRCGRGGLASLAERFDFLETVSGGLRCFGGLGRRQPEADRAMIGLAFLATGRTGSGVRFVRAAARRHGFHASPEKQDPFA